MIALLTGVSGAWAAVPDDYFSTDYEHAVWLSLTNASNNSYVMFATSSTMGTRAKASTNYAAWQQVAFVGTKSSFKIYSYSQGSTKALKAASDTPSDGTTVSWVDPASASTWTLEETFADYETNPGYGICLVGQTGMSLNMYGGAGGDCKFYTHSAGNAGSRWTIAITSGLCVEDGKIYKISSYQNTPASYQIINSATASEVINTGDVIATNQGYWICHESGGVYTFESAMGDGKYLGWYGVSSTPYTFDLHFASSTNTTTCLSLYSHEATGGGRYLYVHKGASGGTNGWNRNGSPAFADGGSTDYKFEEVTTVDIYTVDSNIDEGGVTYKPAYTGTATQTKGGFFVFASDPEASNFTAKAVDNCTPGDITVNTTTKTITVNYTLSPVQLTDAASISSTKVYRLRTDRTAIYAASTSATAVSATAKANASTLNVEEPLNQWAFVEKNSKKYLYNVGAKKFVKTSPYVDYNTSGYEQYSNNHNFLEPYTTHEVRVSAYGTTEGRFWLKDVQSGRERTYNSGDGSFTINGWASADGAGDLGNGWIIEEIPGLVFDPTEALAALDNSISYTFRKVNGDTNANLTASDEERDVATGSTLGIAYNEGYYTPLLQLKDIKVNGTSSSVGTKTIANGDVIEWVYKCPFTVSDAPSNGDFAANTHWYFLNIHSANHYYLNIPESFDYANKIPANMTTKSINDGFLWCITGDNTDGYRLYNKRAGATKVMTFTSGTGAFISDYAGNETASLFTIAHSTWYDEGYTTGAPTFVFSGASARPNVQSYAVASWANSDKGSEFTFEPVEDAILEEITNSYVPLFYGMVGYVDGLSWDAATYGGDLYNEMVDVYTDPTVSGYYTLASHIEASKVQPVENAKYHIISAYPEYEEKQSVKKALYYDTSAAIFKWKTYDSSDEAFTFQLRKSAGNWNIYNPSAGKYLKDCQGSDNASDDAAAFTFIDLGLAQLNISDGTGTMHTGGHSSGAGVSGTITRWGGSLNSASAWYIAPIIETVAAIEPNAVAADADVYQTFANPYDCQIANAEVYYITTQTASTAHIEQATNNYVPAGTGVILKATKAATISIRPISGDNDDNLKSNNILVAGDGSTSVAAGNYMLAYNSTDEMAKFYAIGDGGFVVPANKAYLPAMGSSVKALTLFFGEDVDGIQAIDNNQLTNENAVIYNLAGQRMNKLHKGVNIVNGKKVLVK